MRSEDERLLDLLTDVLEAEAPRPSPEGVTMVRARAILGRSQRQTPRLLTAWAYSMAGVLVVVATFLGGIAVGSDMPVWMRGPVHQAGLPVDSPRLVEARAALDRLGNALARSDGPAVAAEDAAMVSLVKSLNADERAKIEPVAHEVHLRAVEFMAGR
jgi:hypothetical protein